MFTVILFTRDDNTFSVTSRDVSNPHGKARSEAVARKEASRGYAATTVASNLSAEQARMLKGNLMSSLELARCVCVTRDPLDNGPVYA
jgi:hypothetical protein